jgi:uncharacterized protein YjcR
MREKKTRGGKKGNQNALKHGFYSKVVTAAQKRELQVAYNVEGIDEEIALMRVKIRSVLEKDPENIKLLMAATTTLAGLLKANVVLNKNQKKSVAASIGKVIQELAIQGGVQVASTIIGKKLG